MLKILSSYILDLLGYILMVYLFAAIMLAMLDCL
jgi:hypothetical protein